MAAILRNCSHRHYYHYFSSLAQSCRPKIKLSENKDQCNYLCNELIDFDEIWHDDASRTYRRSQVIKIYELKKSKMVTAVIL